MRDPATWIKLNRNILEWRWFKDRSALQVFLYLLLSANTKDNEYKTITIHRGEVVRTQERIAEDTGLSRQQVRTVLCKLEATKEITKESRSGIVVISIVNYNKYQDSNQEVNQPITNDQPRYKNNKKEKKDIYIRPLNDYGGVYLSDDDFDELKGVVKDAGEFLNVIDRAGEWLRDNPRPVEKHKTIVKTFLRNDGLI